MSATESDQPLDDREITVPTVTCDACRTEVSESATDIVPRRYMSLVIDERWCLTCIRLKDEATERALRVAEDQTTPDY